ncbi:MAG TPA: hypothetical protein VKF41_10020 [Bryobacteraceae bacterium]|nr:hypothetical protein [Bryobacteraceae bacterium]
MRAAALFSAVVWAAASAQTLVPPQRGAELFSRGGLGVLKCVLRPLPPVLDFSFRFHAGYVVAVPLSQYPGPGHRWSMMVRLQSGASGQPVYFVDRVHLPDVPNTRMYGELGGGYLLGEGSYRASFLLRDEQGRTCRADWNIEAQLGATDRHVKMAIEPGTAAEVSLRGRRPTSSGDAPLGRLTVLLHAAPTSPRRSTIQASDAVTLLGALSSLLDLAPADSVRLVVFNLDRQKEIYRQEHFTPEQLETVRQAMFDLQLGVVDYQTLQHPEGSVDLLASLVSRELEEENRSDAVVFLGPHGRSADKRALEIGNRGAAGPKFFYVEYQRPPTLAAALGRGPGRMERASSLHNIPNGIDASQTTLNGPRFDGMAWDSDAPFLADPVRDTIEYLVAGLKGKTLVVRTPDEFAKAIKQIARAK